ncbi:MAG: helix-turn-helix transcriptional regulator, partial [Pannonibacter indicus]
QHARIAVEVRAGRLNILAKELEEKLDPLLDRLTPGLLFGSGRSAKRETDLSRPQELVLITQSGTPCRIVMTVTGQEGQEGASHVLIRIHLPRNLPEEIGTALQAVYGLSKSEARLAFFLVVSGSLTDTLDSLSVTRNTAKTHLRRIYEKTGTRSQLELAQVIFRLASLYP